MGDINLVGERLQVFVLCRHGAQRRVVSGVPRARNGKNETAALSTVRTRLTVTGTRVASTGGGRSNANGVSDLGIVVGHEIDLDVTLRRRIIPIDSHLLAWRPVDGALDEITRWFVDDERRVGILVLSNLELRSRSSQCWSGKNSRSGD